MGQLGNYRFNYNTNLAVAPAKADGAGRRESKRIAVLTSCVISNEF